MNKIDLTKAGGFPMMQDALNFMQTAYTGSIQALANAMLALCGSQYVILSGCVEDGANVGSGFVCVAGEVMPFQGGAKAASVVVVEEKTAVAYKDGNLKEAYYNRYAKFGSGSGQIEWASFVKVNKSTPWESGVITSDSFTIRSRARINARGYVELELSSDLAQLGTNVNMGFDLRQKYQPNSAAPIYLSGKILNYDRDYDEIYTCTVVIEYGRVRINYKGLPSSSEGFLIRACVEYSKDWGTLN